ncbi:MAG: translation elongation factor 4 [Spirochaetaceae bacterium]
MKDEQDLIRNFCIIAHIDHGKSTLADRFIEKSQIISSREFQSQLLDSMDIERERGITIKSQAVTIPFKSKDGNTYKLNLVDTPGHVDFSYEVSRAISSCEGALLLVDATQGVEAQTLSNMYMAVEQDLEILPVVNKMDLPSADIDRIQEQIDHDLGLDPDLIFPVSAKMGTGVEELLEGIIEWIPHPKGNIDAPFKANIFDSHYDTYKGVIMHVRVFDGELKLGEDIQLFSTGKVHKVEELGYFRIVRDAQKSLKAGEVGYIISGIKDISEVKVGDTVTTSANPCLVPLEGFRDTKPVVFSSIYPVDADQYEDLHAAIDKLRLNDASLVYEKDSSAALGLGFRCGFLGLLHLEVIQERLEREFGLNIVLTSPSVRYRITPKSGDTYFLDNPTEFPDPGVIEKAEEPYIKAIIITPADYLGNIMNLCTLKRGVQTEMEYLDEKRVEIKYDMPLAEILFDFYDRLKSVSRGYASFDYEEDDFQETDLVKLDILLNGDVVDALSQLVFKGSAYDKARNVCKRLKGEISRHQFKIPIQGAIGSSIIARETIPALRKDVTSKCYGGDISRKKKLLEKQKEGKKRMKMVGRVELPQNAFLSVLRTDEE